MKKIKFSDEIKRSMALDVVGVVLVVVVAVLGATFCIAKLFMIKNLWMISLPLSFIFPVYLAYKYKMYSWKGLQFIVFLALLIFLLGAGSHSAIVGMSAKFDNAFIGEWFPKR